MRVGMLSIWNSNHFFRSGAGIIELPCHEIRDKIILGAMKDQGRNMGGTYPVDRGVLSGRKMTAMAAEPLRDIQYGENWQMIGVL